MKGLDYPLRVHRWGLLALVVSGLVTWPICGASIRAGWLPADSPSLVVTMVWPAAVAALVAPIVAPVVPELRRSSARSLVLTDLAWATTVVAVACLSSVTGCALGRGPVHGTLRNTLGLCGLAVAASVGNPVAGSLLPGLFITVAGVFGLRSDSVTGWRWRWWAWVLDPAASLCWPMLLAGSAVVAVIVRAVATQAGYAGWSRSS